MENNVVINVKQTEIDELGNVDFVYGIDNELFYKKSMKLLPPVINKESKLLILFSRRGIHKLCHLSKEYPLKKYLVRYKLDVIVRNMIFLKNISKKGKTGKRDGIDREGKNVVQHKIFYLPIKVENENRKILIEVRELADHSLTIWDLDVFD